MSQKKNSHKIFCRCSHGMKQNLKNLKTRMSGREVGSPVAQDLVGRGVRAERPAHRDDRMLHCSHPMRAAAENFIRVFFLGHPV